MLYLALVNCIDIILTSEHDITTAIFILLSHVFQVGVWVARRFLSIFKAIKPAGRANKYNTRITDLLTSIKDPEKKDESLNRLMQAGVLFYSMASPNNLIRSYVYTMKQGQLVF